MAAIGDSFRPFKRLHLGRKLACAQVKTDLEVVAICYAFRLQARNLLDHEFGHSKRVSYGFAQDEK
jgi:hypothetical protein